MFVESIELNHFRNYKELDLILDPSTNIFYGDNAQGKTNLLEAIYLCGTSKSHKGSKDREIIQFGEEESHIRLMIKKDHRSHKIDVHLKKNKTKGIAIDGIPIRKASELLGFLHMVFFSPEDLNIIKNGPAERRKFINMELGQLDKIYLYHLVNYNKVLNQRNTLLKEVSFRPELEETLDVWDEQLVKFGIPMIERRQEFVKELNEIIYEIHGRLSGDKEQLQIVYEPSVLEEQLEGVLRKERRKDLKFKTTSVGPHRDDINVMISGIDIRKYGSQGQQRTAALSLKLAEIELIKKKTGDSPILLLDDVLSELDANRQRYLLESIHDIQTMITCTGLDEFIHHQFPIHKLFHVTEGIVEIAK